MATVVEYEAITNRAQALQLLGNGSGLLLTPESNNARVMVFDPISGDLIDPDFIPADPDNLSTLINAIWLLGRHS